MSYEAEVAKEYLRDAFQSGALDITGSYEMVRGFVQIFAGEMDALMAISHCNFLEPAQIDELMRIARPNPDSVRHYQAWLAKIDEQRR